ncbi:MAG: oxidoreductase [Thermoleophilia bacterium]|nr:oxidoreductase [Thermoleophilia bacterium]
MELVDVSLGLLLLRIVFGLAIAAHGAQKLFGWWDGPGIEGFAGWLGSMGVRSPRVAATMAGLSEFVGGLLLALGLAMPVAALLITAVMLTAIATVHWSSGFWSASGGYEYNLAIVAVAIAVATTGPGRYSLDRVFDVDGFAGWEWGLGALVLGAVIAMVNVAGRDTSPSTSADASGEVTAT